MNDERQSQSSRLQSLGNYDSMLHVLLDMDDEELHNYASALEQCALIEADREDKE